MHQFRSYTLYKYSIILLTFTAAVNSLTTFTNIVELICICGGRGGGGKSYILYKYSIILLTFVVAAVKNLTTFTNIVELICIYGGRGGGEVLHPL